MVTLDAFMDFREVARCGTKVQSHQNCSDVNPRDQIIQPNLSQRDSNHSASVADEIGYAGERAGDGINPEAVQWARGVAAGAGNATPLGLGIIWADDPG